MGGQFARFFLVSSALAIASTASAQSEERSSDFNGDGFDDLAIGIPVHGGSLQSTGRVRILFGSENGLVASGSVALDASSIGERPDPAERLGSTLAVGDFNGDGFMDLAVGAPLYTQPGANTRGHGRVLVFFGSPANFGSQGLALGLSEGARQVQFGAALAAGDVNGDGFDELLVGAPNAASSSGGAQLYFGSAEGLSRLDSDGVAVPAIFHGAFGAGLRRGERLGHSLAIANLIGSPWADLVIGIPDNGATPQAGADDGGEIGLIESTPQLASLRSEHTSVIHQDTAEVAGQKEENDAFGQTLTAGRFWGDGRFGLAVGAPGESFENPDGTISSAGVVNVFRSLQSPGSGDLMLHQNVDGVGGQIEAGDRFGEALGVGDFNGDQRDDLVVGVPQENFTGFDRAGVAHVFYGPMIAPSPTIQQLWHHDSPGLAHGVDVGDQFGAAVGTGDFNNDGFADIALGSPGEQLGGDARAGGVLVLYGSARGLSARGSQFWTEAQPEFNSRASTGAAFGSALSQASFRPNNEPPSHRPVITPDDFEGLSEVRQ